MIMRIAHGFPTAGLAVLEFDAEHWPEAMKGNGRVAAFIDPRDLS